jgi:hypothetical protein
MYNRLSQYLQANDIVESRVLDKLSPSMFFISDVPFPIRLYCMYHADKI